MLPSCSDLFTDLRTVLFFALGPFVSVNANAGNWKWNWKRNCKNKIKLTNKNDESDIL